MKQDLERKKYVRWLCIYSVYSLCYQSCGSDFIIFPDKQIQVFSEKTILYYGSFCIAVIVLGCIWYVADWESCVRMVAFTMYICFTIFSLWISRDSFYLAVYKLALVFWFMALFVIGGLEVSILLFHRNVWADIVTRILIITLISWLIERYARKSITGFGNYIEKEKTSNDTNAYENAIYACTEVKKYLDERQCFIHLMIKKRKWKLVIFCNNTCRMETELKDGQPKSEFTGGVGVSSIIRAAEKYGGE